MTIIEKKIYEVNGRKFDDFTAAKNYEDKLNAIASVGKDAFEINKIYYITGYNFWNNFSDAGEEFKEKGLLKICLDSTYVDGEKQRKVLVFSEYSTGCHYTISIYSEYHVKQLVELLATNPKQLCEFEWQ